MSWWNPAYSKRVQLTISAAVGSGVSAGYSIKFNPTGAAASEIYEDCLASGDDLRVVYWDGTSWVELDRDLVTFSATEIEVWFKLQAAIAGGDSDNNYWAYYDNPNAGAPPADKSNVYRFWDDFDDETYDGTWIAELGTWVESGTIVAQTDTTAAGYALRTNLAIPTDNVLIRSRCRTIGDDYLQVACRWGGPGSEENVWQAGPYTPADRLYVTVRYAGTRYFSYLGGVVTDVNIWYILEQIVVGANNRINLYSDTGALIASHNNDFAGLEDTGDKLALMPRRNAEYDWILVRDYVSDPPTVTQGSEESYTVPPPRTMIHQAILLAAIA